MNAVLKEMMRPDRVSCRQMIQTNNRLYFHFPNQPSKTNYPQQLPYQSQLSHSHSPSNSSSSASPSSNQVSYSVISMIATRIMLLLFGVCLGPIRLTVTGDSGTGWSWSWRLWRSFWGWGWGAWVCGGCGSGWVFGARFFVSGILVSSCVELSSTILVSTKSVCFGSIISQQHFSVSDGQQYCIQMSFCRPQPAKSWQAFSPAHPVSCSSFPPIFAISIQPSNFQLRVNCACFHGWIAGGLSYALLRILYMLGSFLVLRWLHFFYSGWHCYRCNSNSWFGYNFTQLNDVLDFVLASNVPAFILGLFIWVLVITKQNCIRKYYNQQIYYVFQFIMQANTELPIPLTQIKQIFKIPVLKVKPMPNWQQSYYQAITSYGDMCLVIQCFPVSQQPPNSPQTQPWLTTRNKLLQQTPKTFPLIFQQHLLRNPTSTYCLTLIQDCTPLQQSLHEGLQVKLLNFTKLVRSLSLIEEKGLALAGGVDGKFLLYLGNSQEICLDFTRILGGVAEKNGEEGERLGGGSYLRELLELMKRLLAVKYDLAHQIHEIIFIQGKIYTFQPSSLTKASDYTQLLIFMNVCLDLQVTILHKIAKAYSSPQPLPISSKPRKSKIRSLQGNPIIQINNKKYSSLYFEQGKCINCLREVFYQELSAKFIHDNSLYKLQEFQHLVVHIFKNYGSSRKEEIITVYPPVSKVELISFLIAYIKCVDPIMKSIQYLPFQNTLKLTFQNRKKQQKTLIMVFYQEYTVKDEQISMILQKSNLQNCKLDLRQMKISDSFLVFLSHIDKARQVQQLYLTDSYGLSDVGLSTFLKSGNCQNLETLSLSAVNQENCLLQESLEIISSKASLKRLYLKKLSLGSSIFSDEIDLSRLSLVELESIGLKVSLSSVVKNTLKILKIDQMVPIEELRNIKHLKLTQLKIRLIQNSKKSLMDSISSFSSLTSSFSNNKNKDVQLFAQGQSKDTLKKLDLSFSNCKFKTLRPLLLMPQLQQINLSNCRNLSPDFQPISPKILSLSFSDTDLDLQQLSTILKNTKEIVQLNIINTKIGKYDIIKLVNSNGKKMFINNLILSELQFSNKLLEGTNGYELVDCVELFVDRLLDQEQEYSFNSLIQKASASSKTLRFILSLDPNPNRNEIEEKKQLLISRINKYLVMNNANLQSLQNLYTNRMKIPQILQIQQNFQVQDSCESTVTSSIAISTDRCRIISSPKIFTRKNSEVPVIFKVLQRETIDKFTHRFVKFMRDNLKFVAVDLRGNKLIGKDVVRVMLEYGRNFVREIDIRDCMFSMNEVIDTIFQFPYLNTLNNGQIYLQLSKQTFQQRSQKYLKFFMHLKQPQSLKISCEQIEQLQILFSVLSHILDQCLPTLKTLSVHFVRIVLNKECQHFFRGMFRESGVMDLEVRMEECGMIGDGVGGGGGVGGIWGGVNRLRELERLVLYLPSFDFPILNLPKLKELDIQFADGQAEQSQLNKCLRNLPSSKCLQILRVSVPNSPKISNLSRVFSLLPVGNLFQKLPNLSHITLNFEYCPLKQSSLYELLGYLVKLDKLSMLELNVSFGIFGFGEFVGCVEKLADQLTRPISIKIICVTENSNTYLLRTQNLAQKGIHFIL